MTDANKAKLSPNWMKTKAEDLEKIIVQLGKEGKNPAQIGLILRDQHGIPKAKLVGKKISRILRENNVQFEGLKEVTEKRVESLKSHMGKNKHDHTAVRSLSKRLWVLHKLQKKQ